MVTLRCGDRELVLGSRTFVMGIVNVTPDSFSDGGRFASSEAAIAHALRLVEDGADVVDIGGESTRPGAAPVSVDVERERVLPVVDGLVRRGVRNISVDTRHASTARLALSAGASWLNDVTALGGDEDMAAVAAGADAVVLMHWRRVAQAAVAATGDNVEYGDVVGEVHGYLAARVHAAVAAGVAREKIVVDPGLGFGKSVDDNLTLLKAGARFAGLGAVLMGPSRKRFLGALTGVDDASARDAATHGAVALAIFHGADIVRVHDVKGASECAKVVDAVVRQRYTSPS